MAPNSLLAFALIRAVWARESFPARCSLVANSSALIWWTRSAMGYLRCPGSPNAELGSSLRVTAFSLAMFENLLESGRLHFQTGGDRVTALSTLAAVFLSGVLCHIFESLYDPVTLNLSPRDVLVITKTGGQKT